MLQSFRRWSALLSILLAAPAAAQDSALDARPSEPSPPTAAEPAAVDAASAPVPGAPALPPPPPVPPPPTLPEPGFMVQNPYPRAGEQGTRLPPPQLYPVAPKPPRRYGDAGAPFSVAAGVGLRFRDDVGYRRLGADDRQHELELFASYDVLQPSPRLVIAAGLGYRLGRAGDADTISVTSHAASAELLARYKLVSWLAPHARAGVGVSTSRVHIEDSFGAFELRDRETSPIGVFGGGITLRTPARLFETYGGKLSSLSFGVLVEGGYVLARAADFRARASDDGAVPQSGVALGRLEQAGPFLRVLGVVRF